MKIDDLTPAFRPDGEMQIPVTLFGQNMRISLADLMGAVEAELRLVCDPPGDIVLWPGEKVRLRFSVMCGSEEVTQFVTAWSINRVGGDAAADGVWDGDHLAFDGCVELSTADMDGLRTCRFNVAATVEEPATGAVFKVRRTL